MRKTEESQLGDSEPVVYFAVDIVCRLTAAGGSNRVGSSSEPLRRYSYNQSMQHLIQPRSRKMKMSIPHQLITFKCPMCHLNCVFMV